MSAQVVRISQGYVRGALGNIGNELDRASGIEHRNSEIETERTTLNISYKDADTEGWYHTFDRIVAETGASFHNKKGVTAFQGLVITSDTAFFEVLGWKRGEPAPEAVQQFFDAAYQWAVKTIGYKGTDQNIISAKVHYDETTPHLQLCFVPIVERTRKKVYETDENGKVLRKGKSPVQKRDENGKIVYEWNDTPTVSKTQFWQERGGKNSYSSMQDDFQEEIGQHYNLSRGEVGSTRKHQTNHQHQMQKLNAEREQITEEVKMARQEKAEQSKGKIWDKKVKVPLDEYERLITNAETSAELSRREQDIVKREQHAEQQYAAAAAVRSKAKQQEQQAALKLKQLEAREKKIHIRERALNLGEHEVRMMHRAISMNEEIPTAFEYIREAFLKGENYDLLRGHDDRNKDDK